MNIYPAKDASGYEYRPGRERARLQLIWSIYSWCGSSGQTTSPIKQPCNQNREHPIAWDLCQIIAAIAGGYVIELSPHYKGVQLIRKNKSLWERVSKFVTLKAGQGCLPYDSGTVGERWEQINARTAHEVAAEARRLNRGGHK